MSKKQLKNYNYYVKFCYHDRPELTNYWGQYISRPHGRQDVAGVIFLLLYRTIDILGKDEKKN